MQKRHLFEALDFQGSNYGKPACGSNINEGSGYHNTSREKLIVQHEMPKEQTEGFSLPGFLELSSAVYRMLIKGRIVTIFHLVSEQL